MALGVIAAPLLVQGIAGCTFTPGSYPPVDDNAYTCACRCKVGPVTRTLTIQAASDDAEQDGSTVDLGGNDLDLSLQLVGLRFADAGIPPGAKITSATVQFTGRFDENATTDLQIAVELSTNAATFAAVNDDISTRPLLPSSGLPWSPGPWAAGRADTNERTPDVSAMIQELVNQYGWTTHSPIVFIFLGTAGQRSAIEYDLNPAQAAKLTITYDPSVDIRLPVCTTPDIAAENVGPVPFPSADLDCRSRIADTFAGLSAACGYPSDCACELLFSNPEQADPSFDRDVCDTVCAETPADSTCSNFNPNGFWNCIGAGGSEQSCAHFVAATNATGNEPVCTASAGRPAMAARLFGRQSTCEVEGTSEIEVGDREPKHDPATAGTVEVLGDPCPGGGCKVATSLLLAMEPIEFSVRFAPDPRIGNLSASGDSVEPTTLSGVDATFAVNTIQGTGNGGNGSGDSAAIDASNDEAVLVGVDWANKLCDLNGRLSAGGSIFQGVCAGDETVDCTQDSPDCDAVGGPCQREADMTVDVHVAGPIVNQPPAADAGADQSVQCTSTSGASFTLAGVATDPDDNIAVTSWRAGSRIGTLLGAGPGLSQSLAVGGSQDYFWRVLDSAAAGDEDSVHVGVVDTVAPNLTLGVSPSGFSKPNHKLVLVTATLTTSDTCDASPAVKLVSITSTEPDNGLGDGDQPIDVQGAAFNTDDRQFLLRNERSGTGRGRIYTITYSATDASGNATLRQATVTVPR